MRRSGFERFAWFVLIYNIGVIAWGAFVRASFSGDGCGSHWPLCNGEVIPSYWSAKTAIEYTHRLMSGVDGLLVLALVIWAFLAYKGSDIGRWIKGAALVSFLFIIIESLIGMGLVKFGWVAHDASSERAVVLAVHLANTFILLGSLSLVAAWSAGLKAPRFRAQGPIAAALYIGMAALLLLGVSGAVTALGDALYPAKNPMAAVTQSLDATQHFLIRLRVLHPLLAVSIGLFLILISSLTAAMRPSREVKLYAGWVSGVFIVQLLVGLLNVALKAPIWMQLVHLVLADVTWIALVLLTAAALTYEKPEEVEDEIPFEEAAEPLAGKELVKAYIVLTKPKVISLLLFTTLAAMFIAAGGWPGGLLFIAVAIGGYMSAGAANSINMVLERDLDYRMGRTAKRPTVTQRISPANALRFGLAMGAGSFLILWIFANLLSAMLAMAGLVFYVVIYTLLLKRRTWHNIVIGGAAGAFPPLVGWAAVTGDLTPLAWMLFAIIFVWTPVHFWALALLIKDDYARAGVPMLPVVRGERVTVIQIGFYSLLTVIVTVLPFIQSQTGAIYLWTAAILNLFLILRYFQLYQQTDRPRAASLYKYSMVYLAVLFLMMAVDRALLPDKTAQVDVQTQQGLRYGLRGVHVEEEGRTKVAPQGVMTPYMEWTPTSASRPSAFSIVKEECDGPDLQA